MHKTYIRHDHQPPHYFRANNKYIVTAATWRKQQLLDSDEKKGFLLRTLWDHAAKLDFAVEAWAILPNHYHFVAEAPEDASTLIDLIRRVHSISARELNKIDQTPGRRVWYNYWDTCITDEGSYLARLHYVNINPLKHGLVEKPEDYEFCSYRWFLEEAEASFRERVMGQPIDQVHIDDDY